MNKKVVLSVLSTALVASMASSAFALEAGLYMGGEVKKYYSIEKFLENEAAARVDANNAGLSNILYVGTDGKAATFQEIALADKMSDVLEKATLADFGGLTFVDAATGETYDPSKDPDLVDPVTPGELKVESVSAITSTAVDVVIDAPKDDVLGATVEVKDNNGNIVEVNPVDISAGDTVASFTFKTPVEKLEGVWTVAGKEYSFTAIQQLKDITDAASASPLNEVKLLNALNAAGIQNVDDNKLQTYATAIVTASPETLVAVQEAIDKANKSDADKEIEAAAEKAVKEATNQIQLLNALKANFERVNDEWIAAYTSGAAGSSNDSVAGFVFVPGTPNANTTVVKNGETLGAVAVTFANIQETIDNVNDAQVAAAYNKAFTSLKSDDVAAARNLANAYVAVDADAKISKKDWANDSLDVLDALIRVNTATTNNTLKTALVALDNLETALVEKYKNNSLGVTVADDLDIKSVKDSNLAEYRKKLSDTTDVTKKNQREDIQKIITDVNNVADSSLVTAVQNAANATPVDADKLVNALNALGLKQVAASNKDVYAANANYKTVADADAAQDEVDADNIAAIMALDTAAEADQLLVALNVVELKNVQPENKVAYAASVADTSTGIGSKSTLADIQTALDDVNKAELEKAKVKAINDATTATEVKAALDKLAVTSYVDVPGADKLYIAEQVLKVRDTLTAGRDELKDDGTAKDTGVAVVADAKTFANVDDLTGHLDQASTGIIAKYDALVAGVAYSNLTNISTTVSKLSAIGYDAFDNLDAGQKATVAEAFKTNYQKDKDGNEVDYATLAAIKVAIDAAIAAQ